VRRVSSRRRYGCLVFEPDPLARGTGPTTILVDDMPQPYDYRCAPIDMPLLILGNVDRSPPRSHGFFKNGVGVRPTEHDSR
jgi:hypothetical protein